MKVPTISRADIFSPANALSLIGLGLAIYGSFTITSLLGVILLGFGRIIDVLDGPVARRTHTSPFGALVDATCDKIGIAFLVTAIYVANYAPLWLLIYVLAQNILNVVINWLLARQGAKPQASKDGKYAMFLQNVSLGFYALGGVISVAWLDWPGFLIAVVSIYFAVHASYGYIKNLPRKK